jgi:hypothetical protein
MVTTIQLNDDVKSQLESLKESRNQTYEEVIIKMMKMIEQNKRKQKQLLIEGCKEMAEDNLKMTKEWETTDSSLDWEW